MSAGDFDEKECKKCLIALGIDSSTAAKLAS